MTEKRVRSTHRLEKFLGGPWPFILPGVLFYLALNIYPLAYQFYLSGTNIQVTSLKNYSWVGFDNFTFIFTDTRFIEAIKFTLAFALITIPVQYAIAFGLALLLNQKIKGRLIFRLTYIIPMVISAIVIGLMFRLIFHQSSVGLANAILQKIGINTIPFFSHPGWARFTVFFVNVWSSVGSTMVFLLGGLQTIDQEVLEAAKVDGANGFQRFFRIVLPLMKTISGLAMIFLFVGTFSIFEKILVLTGGGPANATNTIGYYMFQTAIGLRGGGTGLLGRAAAMGVVMFVIILVFVLLYLRFVMFDKNSEV